METLRAREIANTSSSFLDLVRRIMKEEPDLSEGAAMLKARKNNPSGQKLFNAWSEAGRPGTL